MSDSDWWFVDLSLVIAATGIIAFGLFSPIDGVARILLAIPLLLFLPGYALVAAMYPDAPTDEYRPFDDEKTGLRNPLLVDGGLATVERVALSVIVSVAIVSAVALASTATPWGVTLVPILTGVSALTVALSLVAIVTRYRCPPDRRFSISRSPGMLFSGSRSQLATDIDARPYNLLLIVTMLLLIASTGFALANPPQAEGFTEFYVDTDNVTGETDVPYNANMTAGESTTVPTVVENEEGEERTYTAVAVLQQVNEGGDNATVDEGGGNVTVGEENELARESITVADGERRDLPIEVTPTTSGNDLRLVVLLYEGEAPADPSTEDAYRSVRLPVDVQ